MSKIKRLYQVSNRGGDYTAGGDGKCYSHFESQLGNILKINIHPASLQPYHTQRNESIYPCPNSYQMVLTTFIVIAQTGNNLNNKSSHVYTVGMPLSIQMNKQLMPVTAYTNLK